MGETKRIADYAERFGIHRAALCRLPVAFMANLHTAAALQASSRSSISADLPFWNDLVTDWSNLSGRRVCDRATSLGCVDLNGGSGPTCGHRRSVRAHRRMEHAKLSSGSLTGGGISSDRGLREEKRRSRHAGLSRNGRAVLLDPVASDTSGWRVHIVALTILGTAAAEAIPDPFCGTGCEWHGVRADATSVHATASQR